MIGAQSAGAAPLPIDTLDTPDVDYSPYSSSCGDNMSCIPDASSLGANGGGDHYDHAFGVSVDGAGYNAANGTASSNNLTLETLSLGLIDVSVAFRTTGPYLRQLVTITNTGLTSSATRIGWHNNTGNDGSQQTAMTSDGDTVAETTDQWVVTADNVTNQGDDEVNAWAFNGFGGLAPASLLLVDDRPSFGTAGDEGLTAYFDLVLGAGQTKSLMFFAVAEGLASQGIAGAEYIMSAAGFAALTSDLSTSQLGQVQNWGPQSPAVPLPAGIWLLGGALGLIAARRKSRS